MTETETQDVTITTPILYTSNWRSETMTTEPSFQSVQAAFELLVASFEIPDLPEYRPAFTVVDKQSRPLMGENNPGDSSP